MEIKDTALTHGGKFHADDVFSAALLRIINPNIRIIRAFEVPENFDEEEGHATSFDSAGEPGTEDELEDEHPMSYMAAGGRVKMPHPGFLRAISRMR